YFTHQQLGLVGIDCIAQMCSDMKCESTYISSRILPYIPLLVHEIENTERFPYPVVINGLCVVLAVSRKNKTNFPLILPHVIINKLLYQLIHENEVPQITGVIFSADLVKFELEHSNDSGEKTGLLVKKTPVHYRINDESSEKINLEGHIIVSVNNSQIDDTGQ